MRPCVYILSVSDSVMCVHRSSLHASPVRMLIMVCVVGRARKDVYFKLQGHLKSFPHICCVNGPVPLSLWLFCASALSHIGCEVKPRDSLISLMIRALA